MSEQKSRPVVMDTAAGPLAADPFRLGDLPAGSVLERAVIDVTPPGAGFREFMPGAATIKAG